MPKWASGTRMGALGRRLVSWGPLRELGYLKASVGHLGICSVLMPPADGLHRSRASLSNKRARFSHHPSLYRGKASGVFSVHSIQFHFGGLRSC